MKTTRTLLAIVAAGIGPLAAGQADAGDFFRAGVHAGGHSHAPALTPLWNNREITELAGRAGTGRYFKIAVARRQTYLNVLTTGGRGDSDLYLAYGRLPTPTDHEYASSTGGTDEQVSILHPQPGTWYVLVHGFSGYRDVSLLGSSWQQRVYYDRDDHNRHDATCLDCVNTQVRIAWADHGSRRPLQSLASFVMSRLRNRPAVRHHRTHDRRRKHAARHRARPRTVVALPVPRPSPRRRAVVRRPVPVVRRRVAPPAPRARRRPEPVRRLASALVRNVARKRLPAPIRPQVRTRTRTRTRTTTVARAAQPRPGRSARITATRTTTRRTERQPSRSTNRNRRDRNRRSRN